MTKDLMPPLDTTRFAIEHTALEVYCLDTESRFIEVNGAACRALGYSLEELLRLPAADVDPRFAPPSWPGLLDQLRTGQHQRLESVHRRQDGTQYPVEVNITLLETDHNTLIYCFAQDISHRKQVELALQESRKKLLEAQFIAGIGDFTWEIDSGRVSWSEGMYRLLKYQPDDIIDIRDVNAHVHHPEDRQRVNRWISEGLASNQEHLSPNEYRLVAKDGETLTVQTNARIQRRNGKPVALFGTCQNITRRKRAERALKESSRRYRSVIETARDGFWMLDREGRLLEVNDAYCELSGYTRAELLKMNIRSLEAGESAEATASHIEHVMQRGSDLFESVHRRKAGETWPVEVAVSYSRVEGGRFFAFVRDIHERKLQENLARLRERLAETVYQGDMEQLMRTALDAAEAMTDSRIGFFHFVESDQEALTLQAWSTRTLKDMCCADGVRRHYPVSEAGVWTDCIHQRRPVVHNDYAALPHKKGMPEGHPPLLRELTVPVIRDNLVVAVIGLGNKQQDYQKRYVEILDKVADMAFDFVERKRAEQKIAFMAYYDVLTGLPNRALLNDRLHQAMAHQRRSNRLLAVCYMDLDGFKPVNDRYGHAMGDDLLVSLAKRLTATLREGDTLARLSGDEFIFLLTDLSSTQEAEVIVQRILESISQPFELKGHRIEISGSIGIDIYPTDDASADTLLRHADQAMYQAKSSGRANYRLYDPLQDQRRQAHQRMRVEIDHALGHGELLLHYQPRVELRSGRLVGVEALVRWQHPAQGLLMPGKFLPFIEGAAEEIALGEWVVREALQQRSAWRRQGLSIPVSVNISPKHIQTQGFAEFLRATLADHPPDSAENLELEILETTAIGNVLQVADTMAECIRLGVRFSLDDFGTGYSSLTYFHRLPIDVLKIDQNFVRGMLDDVNDLDIVEGVILLSEALKRPLVAEGVESIELGLLLLNLGCHYAQGYGIAKPMPAQQLPTWLARWKRDNIWQTLERQDHSVGEGNDTELKVAIFSHRRWLDDVIDYLQSESESKAMPLDHRHCQFSRWYNGIGRARYGNHPAYAFIPPKHTRVHEYAEHLINRPKASRKDNSSEELEQLSALSEDLIGLLTKLSDP